MIYINFYHGRPDPDTDMDGWGKSGPVVGPCQFSFTYGTLDVHKDWNEGSITLPEKDGMIKVGDMYYGDFEIMSELRPQDVSRLMSYDEFEKLFPPEKPVTTAEVSPDIDWENDEYFAEHADRYCLKVYGSTLGDLMICDEEIEQAKNDGENPQGFVDELAMRYDWTPLKEVL